MNINFQIENIDYVGTCEAFYPLIVEKANQMFPDKKALKLLLATGTPAAFVSGVMKLLPQRAKDEILIRYVNESSDRLADSINKLTAQNDIPVSASEVTAERKDGGVIELNVSVSDIGYESIAEKLFPVALRKIKEYDGDNIIIKTLSRIESVPEGLVSSLISVLPEDGRDELAVYFINENEEKLKELINGFAKANSVMLDVSGIIVSKNER